MMSKNGTEYKELNAQIIRDTINHVRSPFVKTSRELRYDDEMELIDDFSIDEINEATQEIINLLHSLKEYELIDSYNAFVSELGYEAKEPKIKQITLRQAKLILNELGLLDSVTNYIDNLKDEKLKKSIEIEFEYANEIVKDNPLITTLAKALNLSDNQIDELFIKGSRL